MTDIQEILSVLMYGCHAHPLCMLDGFAAVARPVVETEVHQMAHEGISPSGHCSLGLTE